MTFLDAIILAIIEGLTEFLPISSTGHMIIAPTLMGNASNDFVKLFTVAIQFGAILSVVLVYFQKFLQSFRFYLLLCAAFIPTHTAELAPMTRPRTTRCMKWSKQAIKWRKEWEEQQTSWLEAFKGP